MYHTYRLGTLEVPRTHKRNISGITVDGIFKSDGSNTYDEIVNNT